MRAHGAGRVRVALALAGAALCLAPGLVVASPAQAAATAVRAGAATGTAAIRGVVLLGVAHVPVAGAAVTLHGAGASSDPITATGTTDGAGKFEFDGLAGGSDWTYTVTTVHSGVTFSTDVIGVDPASTATVTLSVYETTTAASPITRKDWTVWLDITGATMAVEQDVTLVNAAGTAYRTEQPLDGAPDQGHAAVLLPVSPGATNLQYVGWFEVCCDAVVGRTWAHTRPIPPGTTTGTMRYEAPTPASLTFLVDQPTTSFTVLAPQGTSVTSSQLTSAGTQTDRGTTYQVLRAGPLAVGTTITLSLAAASSFPWTAVVVTLGVLGTAAAGLWWWRRSRRTAAAPAVARPGKAAATSRPAPAAPAAKPVATTSPSAADRAATGTSAPTGSKDAVRAGTSAPSGSKGTTPAGSTPVAAASASERAQAGGDAAVLADELAMLDLAHDSGALPDDASYQRVRESLVARLMAAMGTDPEALREPSDDH